MVARSKKVLYFAHLAECLNKYSRAFIVDVDFVGSKQVSDIRIALRGKAELVFGKNTMIRRCIKNLCVDGDHPEWEALIPYMVGNVGFVFTNGELSTIEEVVKEYVKPAAAKAGVIAPVSCTVPKGPTGLDPAQTSFFQALNIGTKINKGSIEIINDCKVLIEGEKVRGRTLTARAPMAHTKRPPNCGFQIRARGSTPPPPRTAVKAATACVTQDHSCCAMALATCAHAMHLGAPHISRLPHILE
jgi:large subunit ribosomal protein LP0